MTHYSRRNKNTSIRRSFPLHFSRKKIIGCLVGLVILLFSWLGRELTVVALPDADAPPTLYANQTHDDLRRVFSGAIAQAKESVLVVVYSLTDDAIIEQLRKKADEGVAVSVVCDAKASPYVGRRLGKSIALVRRFGAGLMHQKIVVIDHKQTWIGSANMTTDSLQSHGNLVMAIPGEALARSVEEKAASMEEEELLALFPHKTFSIKGQQLELWFLPDNKEATAQITQLLRTAKKTIRVAMFTWTRQDFAQEIVNAARRGVDVQVVIDSSSAKGASSHVANYLKRSGINVGFGPTNVLLHHKFLYVDDTTLVNGSANWTKAAFNQNDECFIVLHNLLEEQQKKMKALWQVIQSEATKG